MGRQYYTDIITPNLDTDMAVEVVVVTHNAKEHLLRCIRSVRENTTGKYMLKVVDNASSDGTRGLFEGAGRIKGVEYVRYGENLGFSKAANIALEEAKSDTVALLDDDVEVGKGWLRSLVSRLREDEVGISGPKVLNPDGTIQCAEVGYMGTHMMGRNEYDRGHRDYRKECDGLIGPCWVMRKAVYEEGVRFDEDMYPCQGEDVDYCLNARRRGWKIIYDGRASVIHHNLLRDMGNLRRNNRVFAERWAPVRESGGFKDSHPVDNAYIEAINSLEKDPQRTLRIFREIDESIPSYVPAAFYAQAYIVLGEKEQAAKWLEKAATDMKPGFRIMHMLVKALYDCGRNDEAKRYADQLLQEFSVYNKKK
jgi:GT2 family glycosyltransferase